MYTSSNSIKSGWRTIKHVQVNTRIERYEALDPNFFQVEEMRDQDQDHLVARVLCLISKYCLKNDVNKISKPKMRTSFYLKRRSQGSEKASS